MERSELSARVNALVNRIETLRASICSAQRREAGLCEDIDREDARSEELTSELDVLNEDLQRALEDQASASEDDGSDGAWDDDDPDRVDDDGDDE